MSASSQLAAINQVLEHARSSDFYRGRLPEGPVQSWDDFRRIPFITKEDVRRQSPHGLVCVPGDALSQYHESSATTGEPVSAWYTNRDLSEIRERFAQWGVGFRGGERVLVRFPYALSTIGHFVHAAAQHAGACVIPADSRTTVTPLPRVVELLRRLDITVLATLSLSAVMVAETAEMAGLDPRRDFPRLRAICCAGEPLSPSRRRLLEEIWGIPVYDNYGMTETGPQAMDCQARRLHPWQDQFLMEILDDRLEQEVAPGETGELVVTSLTPRAMPMIRYQTGDRGRRLEEPCACGEDATLEIRGRAADTVWIGERPFDQWTLEAIVSELPSRRFWRVTPTKGGLRFVVERERDEDRIEPDLLWRLEQTHGTRLSVELVPKGTLYDRREQIAFGMSAKPIYIDREHSGAPG
ncbi:phenylacetate--CoA ligase family protein [Chondromyces apiculatus]|uniref:Phenylacetate-coenzyme A ligase n=1 Tax=Chondromyces apiculatus DSM 436 TaxID=1192034 RepID=A0A017SX77_9BACT|nr:AMP-binding protein [Chondromyces apiculatus]EYF01225.1 Phenylacetate-coenzyme A ligase [Chondromyces apiculatus DSM 436]